MNLKSNSELRQSFRTMLEKKHYISSYTAEKIIKACGYDSRLCLEVMHSGSNIERRKVMGTELVGDHYLVIIRSFKVHRPHHLKFGEEKARDIAKLKELRDKTKSLKNKIDLLNAELSDTNEEIEKVHRKYDLRSKI